MEQPQCPNCGGYQLHFGIGKLFWVGLFTVGWMVFTLPILLSLDRKREQSAFLEGRKSARCELCGYRFRVHQLSSEPMEPNQQLIQLGRRKLERDRDWYPQRKH